MTVSENSEIDLREVLATLWRGKWLIALCAILAAAFGVFYAVSVAVPEYSANTVVMLESREEKVVDIESVMSGLSADSATVNTEVEVIRSRELMRKLVERMELTNDPEFNKKLRPVPTLSPGNLIKLFRTHVLGQTVVDPELSERQIRDATIDSLLSSVRVRNLRDSYVFEIRVESQNGMKSVEIANTLADLYINQQLEVKFQATEQATTWLSERVGDLQTSLEQAEADVKEFAASTDLISVEALTGLNRQIKELRDRRASAQMAFDDLKTQSAALRAAQSMADASAMARAVLDPDLARLARDADLAPDARLVLEGSGGAEADLRRGISRALMRLELDQSRTLAQMAALDKSLEELGAQIEGQSADLVKLRQLERESEASRLIYEFFLSRLKETSVQQGIQQADSRVLSYAVEPLEPFKPRKSLVVAMAFFMGVIFGAGIVLWREMRQTTIRSAEDLERNFDVTVMGQIPKIPHRKRSNVLAYLVDRPNSAAAEAVRNLRTSVLLSNLDRPPQVVMSTSSLPGEGKTTQSLALAQNLSGLGKKVMLIEGDIRRRVFSQYFDVKDPKGLLPLLAGDVTLDEAKTYVEQVGVDVLVAQPSKVNAADLFSSDKFKALIDDLREAYDYIVIDTPPVLVVPDARVIGQSVDVILYTVKWDQTTRAQVRDGLRMFETVGLDVTGLVLGQIDARGMKRYGYGGSYGAYSAYGSKYYTN